MFGSDPPMTCRSTSICLVFWWKLKVGNYLYLTTVSVEKEEEKNKMKGDRLREVRKGRDAIVNSLKLIEHLASLGVRIGWRRGLDRYNVSLET